MQSKGEKGGTLLGEMLDWFDQGLRSKERELQGFEWGKKMIALGRPTLFASIVDRTPIISECESPEIGL